MILSFDSLPEEVLRTVLGYMDIPSIVAMSMTHKPEHDNIASLASDDATWYALIQNRFGIGCNHRRHRRSNRKHKQGSVVLVTQSSSSSLSSDSDRTRSKRRPNTYGGATWKDAYRSLNSTMRIPETSITSGSHVSSGGAVFASPYPLHGRNAKKSVADFFGVWCLVNHAENCRSRTVQGLAGRRRRRRNHHDVVRDQHTSLPYRLDRRYMELKLCMQNTKSGFGRVVIPDISAIRIASLDEEEYFSSWGWDKWDHEFEPTFKVIEVGPWAPKIALRRRFNDDIAGIEQNDADTEEWNAKSGKKDIILRPFEVVVLSVHVSVPDAFVYETDVLSSMASIRVPIVANGWPSINQEDGKACMKTKDVATARFIPEDALWEFYCQLPGGCLSLTDRSRLVPV